MDTIEKNDLIDILFDQIDRLNSTDKLLAVKAVELIKSSQLSEFLGLGPAEARHDYKVGYLALANLNLELGGFIPPYESNHLLD